MKNIFFISILMLFHFYGECQNGDSISNNNTLAPQKLIRVESNAMLDSLLSAGINYDSVTSLSIINYNFKNSDRDNVLFNFIDKFKNLIHYSISFNQTIDSIYFNNLITNCHKSKAKIVELTFNNAPKVSLKQIFEFINPHIIRFRVFFAANFESLDFNFPLPTNNLHHIEIFQYKHGLRESARTKVNFEYNFCSSLSNISEIGIDVDAPINLFGTGLKAGVKKIHISCLRADSLSEFISTMPNIEEIILSIDSVSSLSFLSTNNLSKLRFLEVNNGSELPLPEVIMKNAPLEHLFLKESSSTTIPSSFQNLMRLQTLSIRNAENIEDIKNLEYCPSLKKISLRNVKSNKIFKQLSGIRTLTDFETDNISIKKFPNRLLRKLINETDIKVIIIDLIYLQYTQDEIDKIKADVTRKIVSNIKHNKEVEIRFF